MILKLKYILKAAFLSQLLFSCTERSLEPRPEPEPVPIRLFTGIRTRATVDVFGDTPVCVAYGVRTGQYDGSWDGIATDNEIRLDARTLLSVGRLGALSAGDTILRHR
ncbi:hypothetical protein NXV19_15125 [Bacteroides fragilis]|nr:hypothetical protein NXV19_15125 [Bacteroides fragilis]